jgi:cell wall-associated NlpC family hydrolase
VNAPSRHAQYIAAHLPYAEAWIPKGVRHTVHDEIPAEWLAVVQSFLERRGDPLNDALHHLKQDAYPDPREWVFDLRAAPAAGAPGRYALSGEALTLPQVEAAAAAVAQAAGASPSQIDAGAARILLTAETPWALVNHGVIDLYEKPTIHSDRFSQGLPGEALRILEENGAWVRVRMERDGYMGWMLANRLHRCDAAAARDYLAGCTHRVQAELLPAWATFRDAGDISQTVGKLVFGSLVFVDAVQGGYACVRLPDRTAWWAPEDGLLPRQRWPQPDAAGIAEALTLVRRFTGTPYLWGGRSPFGYDCSGLTGAFWDFLGVALPRDADLQRQAGKPVEGPPQPGDLLFFVRETPAEIETRADAVSHVGISLGGGRFLHASGIAWGVTVNSLDPEHPEYSPEHQARFLDARRYSGARRTP